MILLAALGAGYYWYLHRSRGSTPSSVAGTWTRVTAADAQQGGAAVAQLQSNSGRVFANLTASQAVGYLLQTVGKQLPPTAEDVQAMIAGDTLYARAVLPLRSLGVEHALGPLAALLGDRDSVEFAGTADVIRPGLAQFRLTRILIHGLALPSASIPKLVTELRRQPVPGLAPNGLALPLPPYIGDIRIANGKVTLYKNV